MRIMQIKVNHKPGNNYVSHEIHAITWIIVQELTESSILGCTCSVIRRIKLFVRRFLLPSKLMEYHGLDHNVQTDHPNHPKQVL